MTSLKILSTLTFSLCLASQLSGHIDQSPPPTTQQIENGIAEEQLQHDEGKRPLDKYERIIWEIRWIQSLFTPLQKDIITYFIVVKEDLLTILDALEIGATEFFDELDKVHDIQKEHGLSRQEILRAFAVT